MSRKRLGQWVLAVGVVLVAMATLQPQPTGGPQGNPESLGAADRLANIILFLPVGIGMGLMRVRWWRALLAGVLFSTGIELAQLIIPGRFTNPWDVAMNGLGAGLGLGVPWLLTRPPGRLAASLGLAAAITLITAEAWLAQPVLQGGPYAVRLRPPGRNGRWDGKIHQVQIGGTVIRAGALRGRLPARLGEGWPLRLVLEAPVPEPKRTTVFEIRSGQERTLVKLASQRGELELLFADRGIALGFGGATMRAMTSLSPGPHTLMVHTLYDGMCLTVDGEERCGLGPSVARGWARIHHINAPAVWMRRVLDGLWMVGLAGLIGLWAPSPRWVIGAYSAAFTVGIYLVANTGLGAPSPKALAVSLVAVFAARPVWARITSWGRRAS